MSFNHLLLLTAAVITAAPLFTQLNADTSPYALSMSTYLGDTGNTEDVVGIRILSNGNLAVAVNVGTFSPETLAPASAELRVLGNATATSPGVLMLLDRSGQQILAISRIAESVNALDIDDADNLYVACANDGLMKLNPQASVIEWTLFAGEFIHRVAVSPSGWVVAHRPSNTALSSIDTSPAEGVTHLVDPTGALYNSMPGIRNTVDVAVDEVSQTVIQVGWRQASTVQPNLSTIPVQIAYLRGLNFAGELQWVNYDWDAFSNISGGTQFIDGNLIITNPKFINTNGQPNGVDDEGRTTYAFVNNMADTRGYRVRMGRDGLVYAAYEAAGGNHIFKNRGLHALEATNFREGFPKAGGDSFHSFINTGAGHKTYIGRYNPATGEIIAGNEYNTLIRQNNNSMGANTLRVRAGGLAVDQSGQLFFGGASASGLPFRSNEFFNPNNSFNSNLFAIDAFGQMDTAGGAYLWGMDATMQNKLVISRIGYGNTRSVDARILEGETHPLVVYAGISGLERPMLMHNPLQASAGYGTADGFIVVLGGEGLEGDNSLFQFSYGGSGVSYTSSSTRLRGVLETQYVADLDGDGVFGESIAEYAWNPNVPLNPPAPNYTGPIFRGGIRAKFFNATNGNFPTNSYSGNNTNIRVQRSAPVLSNQNGVFFFDKADLPGVSPEDTLLLNEHSILSIAGTGFTGGRWLVRDGEQYYVSLDTFSGTTKQGFQHAGDIGRWAPFDIDADMQFNVDQAIFANRQFTDITAIGFIVSSPTFTSDKFQMQWNTYRSTLAKNIVPNQAPKAIIQSNFNQVQNNPHTISFDAGQSYDPDGYVSFYFWQFGNGQSSGGPVVQTEYRAAGKYSPVLTVWDDGLVTDSVFGYVEIGAPTAPNPERLVAAWGGDMPTGGFRGKIEQSTVDLNGDGVANNTVRGWHFSETIPMTTNTRGTRWFGGLLSHYYGSGSVNFHDGGISNASPYDRFNVRFQRGTTGLTAALHGAVFLDKSEFFGSAAFKPVRFNAESRMSMGRISRFNNIGQLRWMVREGDTYYVSQELIAQGNPTVWTPISGTDDGIWAEYDPEAFYMDFDQDNAVWETRKFQDLTAFGIMWDKDAFDETTSWLEFNEFYVEAESDPMDPVVVTFIADTEAVAVNAPITFDSSASSGPFALWHWSFGDGNYVRTGPTATYAYSTEGVYNVTLTMTDLFGVGHSYSRQVVVGEPQEPEEGFAAWRVARFTIDELADPVLSGPQGTPDGDGIKNLVKYAFNLPRDMAGISWPVETTLPDDRKLSVMFPLLSDRNDIFYQVVASSDLSDWDVIFDSRFDIPDLLDGSMATVIDSVILSAGSLPRFLRVAISATP